MDRWLNILRPMWMHHINSIWTQDWDGDWNSWPSRFTDTSDGCFQLLAAKIGNLSIEPHSHGFGAAGEGGEPQPSASETGVSQRRILCLSGCVTILPRECLSIGYFGNSSLNRRVKKSAVTCFVTQPDKHGRILSVAFWLPCLAETVTLLPYRAPIESHNGFKSSSSNRHSFGLASLHIDRFHPQMFLPTRSGS